MSGWMGKAVKAVQGSNKAIIKKGSSVSTDKIPDGRVEFVEPNSKKVTVQSKDGKQRETIKSKGVRVKSGTQTTNPDKLYADRSDPVVLKDLSEDAKLNMSEGELLQRIIRSGESGKGAARRLFPTDSLGDIRGRNIAYKGTKIKPDRARRNYEKNIFARGRQEAKEQVNTDELVAKQREARNMKDAEYAKRHSSQPTADMPEFKLKNGDTDITKLRKAFQDYRDTKKWKKGGSVNVKKKKKYREVTNRFSDRMLPNKKRTTRIY